MAPVQAISFVELRLASLRSIWSFYMLIPPVIADETLRDIPWRMASVG
jgi:hypothetical protein